ncbi:MAG: endo-1,4-beta-xylanase, partial [Treponema sp.]|nr:endo-1,4-beta-xylanase [Treponema sp.]
MKKIYFLLTIILIFGCTTNAGLTDNEHGTRFSTTFNRTNDNVYFSSGNACDFALFSAQGAGRNDNNVLRVRNEDPDNFTSSSNYLRLTLPESLPEGGTYRISAWFYVPNEGNENKSTLTGPGIVLNGNYAGSNGIAKFPVNPGTISVNRWTHVDVTLPLAQEPLRTVDFRFVVNSEPNHPSVWYIDDITITQIGGVIALERAEWDLTLPSLCSVYNGKFLIGNAIDYNDLNKDEMKNMYKHHYNAITAGNSMKPDSMWPQRDRQNFTNADNLVNWA